MLFLNTIKFYKSTFIRFLAHKSNVLVTFSVGKKSITQKPRYFRAHIPKCLYQSIEFTRKNIGKMTKHYVDIINGLVCTRSEIDWMGHPSLSDPRSSPPGPLAVSLAVSPPLSVIVMDTLFMDVIVVVKCSGIGCESILSNNCRKFSW